MEIIVAVIVPIIAALAGWVTGWALRKAGLDPAMQVKAIEIVRDAVLRAEGLALNSAKKIKGGEKMHAALAMADQIASYNPQIAAYVRAHGERLAESILSSSLTPHDMTPGR
jgi:hypothetical protein